ncbi:FhaA domain-containing protein [Glutamicibacter halophytocola]|uniref:FhaA domain-containing protein n=1 Tax=Glutamicibacter halophytocola TaxID=1933880 RepID=UPI003D2A0F86
MGFLDNVERGLEKVVTSFFRGTSTADLKPVELTTALRNEMDRGILPISEGRRPCSERLCRLVEHQGLRNR